MSAAQAATTLTPLSTETITTTEETSASLCGKISILVVFQNCPRIMRLPLQFAFQNCPRIMRILHTLLFKTVLPLPAFSVFCILIAQNTY